MAQQHVVILGEAWIDEIRDSGGVRENVTGDAVELATALLAHGLALTVVAPVGEDADGERIHSVLKDRGVRLVPVPAPDGTLRRALVRDRSGAEVELRRREGRFADTRRSLAAQAEADVIVDLRGRDGITIAEERDEVLRALDRRDEVDVRREEAATEGPGESAVAEARAQRLLPAPVVAGTYRHAPARLLPDPPAAHAPAPDWHGLEARLARIAT